MNSYLFYDIETTGLNKAFDQILQFASIRTDPDMKEMDRCSIRIALRPDVIVSPGALLTHRIAINDILVGSSEFEAARQIHSMVNEPGTVSIGYNSLGFDDEFLRFTFHRNLLPPYTHQYDKGCRRMDLLPIAVMYRLYRETIIAWPQNGGKPTLKLEHLNSENQLAPGRSHDAMNDVEATVALARRFAVESDMWEYLCGYFIKEIDRTRAEKLPLLFSTESGAHRQGLLIASEFGSENHYQVPVLSIGHSEPYKNQSLWLRLDLPELAETTPESVADTSWVIRKRYGEPGILLPPHERYWSCLHAERRRITAANLKWLQENPELFQRIVQYHRTFRYPEIPDLDPDAALYQMGFLSPQASAICEKFHASPPMERRKLLRRFPTQETHELALRILARNFPESLDVEEMEAFHEYMGRVNPDCPENALLDYKGDRRTTPLSALAEIHKLQQDSSSLDTDARKLLADLYDYILSRFEVNRPFSGTVPL